MVVRVVRRSSDGWITDANRTTIMPLPFPTKETVAAGAGGGERIGSVYVIVSSSHPLLNCTMNVNSFDA